MASGPPGLDAIIDTARGEAAQAVLPIIEAEASRMRATVFAKVFTGLRDGTLTPEQALNFWTEIYAYHRLLKNFEQVVSMGHSAAARSPAAQNRMSHAQESP